jgi:hypothetical protein
MNRRKADDIAVVTDRGEPVKADRRFISLVEAQQRRAQTNHEKPQEAALVKVTRRLVTATYVLAFIAFCALIAAFLQWRTMSATDEHIAKQAEVMQGQLNEMEIARRPWVTADINLGDELTMRDEGFVEIQTIIILRNPGQTPATETSIGGVGFLPIAPFTTAENALACQQADLPIQRGMSIGPNVFPGDRKILNYTFNITKNHIEAYWAQSPTMKPTLFPFLVICIAYMEHAGGKIHHTSFAFQIMGTTKPEMPIPISELRFRTFPFATLPPD